MTLYLARDGRKRCYVIAPNRTRAIEIATLRLGATRRPASVTAIDDEVVVDIASVTGGRA